MRKNRIKTTTLDLLYQGQYKEALDDFKATCEDAFECVYDAECSKRCLIPKLRYMILLKHDERIEKIIADLSDW